MAEAGRVEAIYLRPAKSEPLEQRERVRAVARRGLEGDYKLETRMDEPDRSLTLIEQAAYDHLAAQGLEVELGAIRRNLVTSGIALNDLVGKRFSVGGVECLGTELCHPCNHIQDMTRPGVLKALADRGGLCAEILSDGEIAVGAAVEPLD